MAKIIEARAVISAEDRTGGVFDKIAKKIDGLAKSAKTSKAVDALAKSLDRARSQMAAIDKFDLSRGELTKSRQRFREAQAAVQGMARAMASTSAPTRQMEQDMKRAQDAVRRTARAYEMQKDAAISNKRAIEGMGVNVKQAAAHQTRLRSAIEQTSSALDRHEKAQQLHERSQLRRENRRVALGTAAVATGAFAGHAVKAGTKATLHTYREFDKERRFGKAVMGLSDDEQKPLVDQAIHMGATTKFNDIQVLEAQRELAARGLKKDQIMGMMKPAGDLGMAMDLKLPDAVKQMEGAMFGFKKNISDLASSMASAKQTADYQVKAAKLSGMTPEDISQLYKFGATPARMGGVSEATLLGFGGVLKKANIGGDEAGVAFRALMSTIQSPTAGGKTAMLANGLNYKNYQTTRDRLDVDPFAADVAARYGVKLDKKSRAGLGKIFGDKEMISDPSKFNPAVTAMLRETLGGSDAKSLKSIAGAAGRYRDSSVNSVDANAMIKDLLPKLANNLPLANKLFGAKQGGRIATALGDSDTLQKIIGEIEKGSEGYAGKIATERMAGFDGAVSRFEGAVKNLETAVGRSFDQDGKGGALTWITDAIGKAIQSAAEANPTAVKAGAIGAGVLGVGASGYGAFKFMQLMTAGGALTGSAVALDASAAALSAAAAALGGSKAVGAATSAAASAAAGAGGSGLWAAGAAALPWLAGGAGIAGGLYAMHKSVEDAGYGGMTSGERMRKQRGGSMRETYAKNWGYPSGGGPEVTPTMTYGTGTGGDKSSNVTVSGQMTGEGKLVLEINAGSSLIDVARRAEAAISMAASIQSNGPGSTGKSSPDAAAPSPRGNTGSASGAW